MTLGDPPNPEGPDEQVRIVLTAHPLQRIGAFALAALAARAQGRPDRTAHPVDLPPDDFAVAVERMVDDAVDAAEAGRRGEDSFWLKASGAFFPNAKMNHRPTLGKRSRADNRELVRAWRTMPAPSTWPKAPCAPCGRDAVAFYGKVDVPLVDAAGYCNTTPRGHEGLALCWPCVCCFHALPYGSRLTGGPSTGVHSWDDTFLRSTTEKQVGKSAREISGFRRAGKADKYEHERTALLAIRRYDRPIAADVELMVFSNDNRGASLGLYGIEAPLAEWIRSTLRDPELRRGWRSLLAAYEIPPVRGNRRLARDAFHRPWRIFTTAASRLTERSGPRGRLRFEPALVALTYSFLREVMDVNQADIDQVEALATEIAQEIVADESAGPLMSFRVACRGVASLQKWLENKAVRRALRPPKTGVAPPLLTTAQFRLLFDPDGQGWIYRRLLLIAVLNALHQAGWRPADADDHIAELPEPEDDITLAREDDELVEGLER